MNRDPTGEKREREARIKGKIPVVRAARYKARAAQGAFGQLPAGAWSHLMALRQGATSPLLIGVCSHTIRLCRAINHRLGPLSLRSGRGQERFPAA
jgi:hypothetical protein